MLRAGADLIGLVEGVLLLVRHHLHLLVASLDYLD